MSGVSTLRRWLVPIGLLVSLLAAAILWVQWPEIALAFQGESADEGLLWLISLNAGPVLILVTLLYLLRRHFHIAGPRRAAETRHLIEMLKEDGQAARLCDTCGGTGTRGSSRYFSLGRAFLAQSVCKKCRGTGMMRGCQHCGYNLTGNVSGVCPECGKPCERDASTT